MDLVTVLLIGLIGAAAVIVLSGVWTRSPDVVAGLMAASLLGIVGRAVLRSPRPPETTRRAAINRRHRRVARMFVDLRFWVSTAAGIAVIAGTLWHLGLRTATVLALVGTGWLLLSMLLNYGSTLLRSTSHCRTCGYELGDHLGRCGDHASIQCPECATIWARSDLELGGSPIADDELQPWSPTASRRPVDVESV